MFYIIYNWASLRGFLIVLFIFTACNRSGSGYEIIFKVNPEPAIKKCNCEKGN